MFRTVFLSIIRSSRLTVTGICLTQKYITMHGPMNVKCSAFLHKFVLSLQIDIYNSADIFLQNELYLCVTC
jgi:hypothetical protein